jgi:hypothetical protein
VELWEVQDVADRIVVQVPSLQKLLAQLNEAGEQPGGGDEGVVVMCVCCVSVWPPVSVWLQSGQGWGWCWG